MSNTPGYHESKPESTPWRPPSLPSANTGAGRSYGGSSAEGLPVEDLSDRLNSASRTAAVLKASHSELARNYRTVVRSKGRLEKKVVNLQDEVDVLKNQLGSLWDRMRPTPGPPPHAATPGGDGTPWAAPPPVPPPTSTPWRYTSTPYRTETPYSVASSAPFPHETPGAAAYTSRTSAAVAELAAQLDRMRREMKEQQRVAEDRLSEAARSHAAERARAEQEIDELRRSVKELQRNSDEALYKEQQLFRTKQAELEEEMQEASRTRSEERLQLLNDLDRCRRELKAAQRAAADEGFRVEIEYRAKVDVAAREAKDAQRASDDMLQKVRAMERQLDEQVRETVRVKESEQQKARDLERRLRMQADSASKDLQDSVAAAQREIRDLKRSLAEKNAKVQHANAALETHSREFDALLDAEREKHREADLAAQARAATELAAVKRQLEAARSRLDEALSQAADASTAGTQLDSLAKDLEATRATAAADLDAMRGELAAAKRRHETELEDVHKQHTTDRQALQALRAELEDAQESVASAKREAAQATREAADAKAEVAAAEAKAAQLRQQLEGADVEASHAHAAEVAALKLALDRAKRDHEELEEDSNRQMQAVRKAAETRVLDAEASASAASKQRRDLQVQLDEALADTDGLRRKHRREMDALRDEHEAAAAKKASEAVARVTAAHEGELEAIRGQLAAARTAETTSELSEVQAQLDASGREVRRLQAAVEAAEQAQGDATRSLRERLMAMERERDEEWEKTRAARAQVANLTDELAAERSAGGEVEALRKKLAAAEEATEAARREAHTTDDFRANAVVVAAEDRARQEAEAAAAARIAALNTRVQDLQAEVDVGKGRIAELAAGAVSADDDAKRDLERQLEHAVDAAATANARVEELEADVAAAEEAARVASQAAEDARGAEEAATARLAAVEAAAQAEAGSTVPATELAAARADADAARQALLGAEAAHAAALEAATKDLEGAQTRAADAEATAADLRRQLEDATQAAASQAAHIQQLEEGVDAANKAAQSSAAEVAAVRKDLDVTKRALQDAEAEVSSIRTGLAAGHVSPSPAGKARQATSAPLTPLPVASLGDSLETITPLSTTPAQAPASGLASDDGGSDWDEEEPEQPPAGAAAPGPPSQPAPITPDDSYDDDWDDEVEVLEETTVQPVAASPAPSLAPVATPAPAFNQPPPVPAVKVATPRSSLQPAAAPAPAATLPSPARRQSQPLTVGGYVVESDSESDWDDDPPRPSSPPAPQAEPLQAAVVPLQRSDPTPVAASPAPPVTVPVSAATPVELAKSPSVSLRSPPPVQPVRRSGNSVTLMSPTQAETGSASSRVSVASSTRSSRQPSPAPVEETPVARIDAVEPLSATPTEPVRTPSLDRRLQRPTDHTPPPAAARPAFVAEGEEEEEVMPIIPYDPDLSSALREAMMLVLRLTADQLEAMRSSREISNAVAVVAGSICMLFGHKPSWKQAVVVLREPDFKQRVRDMRPWHLTDSRTLHVIRKLIRSKNLEGELQSPACDPVTKPAEHALVRWILALCDPANGAPEVIESPAAAASKSAAPPRSVPPQDPRSPHRSADRGLPPAHPGSTPSQSRASTEGSLPPPPESDAELDPHAPSDAPATTRPPSTPAVDVAQFQERLEVGIEVTKHGRWGRPKKVVVSLGDSGAGYRLYWRKPGQGTRRESESSIKMRDLLRVTVGADSAVGRKKKSKAFVCFSLEGTTRALDLEADTPAARDELVAGFQAVLDKFQGR